MQPFFSEQGAGGNMTDIDGSQVQFATKLAHRSIRTVIAFSLIGIGLMTAERFVSNRWLAKDYAKLAEAEGIAGRLLLADEQMNTAAASYVIGASPVWKSHYNIAAPKVAEALADAKRIASKDIAEAFELATKASRNDVIAMNSEAFALAEKGDHMSAVRKLRSIEYELSQKNLKASTDKMLTSVKAEVAATISKSNTLGMTLVTLLVLLGGLTFSMVWRKLTKALKKSEVAFFTAEQQIRDELSSAHVEMLRQTKMSQLGQLTATIAHELRNPLGSVRTSAFILERKYINTNPEMAGPMGRIKAGIVRCDNIITQLLDYSRNSIANKTEVVMDDWLEKTIHEQAESISPQVSIQCNLGLGQQKVGIDPDRLERVLVNLLANASEAMVGKGDKPIAEGAPPPMLTIESQHAARGIEIRVKDNGPGIPADVLPRIFDPMFTTKNFGTGLGLPAVQKILEQHNGGLEVHSTPGEGATFTAWLPLPVDEPQQKLAA